MTHVSPADIRSTSYPKGVRSSHGGAGPFSRATLSAVALGVVATASSSATVASAQTYSRAEIAGGSPAAAAVLDAGERVAAVGPLAPGAIWPDFRPDTLAVVLSVAGRGWLLSGWRAPFPEGFAAVDGSPGLAWRPYRAGEGDEANTIRLEGRPWIFYGASGGRAEDLGNAVHEAFHLLERALRPAGRFPPGENSFQVVSYPEFDAENEAGFALEGRLLDAALAALPDTATAAALAREFVAVRESRQRRLDADDALFERRTELNEGVAQYAYVRALQMVAEGEGGGDPDARAWARDARAEIATQRALLADLIGARRQSVRLRFYATGSAQALLLDALAGPPWKERVMADGTALQDLVAEAVGYRDAERALVAAAGARHPALEAAGAAAVEALARARRERAEDALSGPGVRIDVDASALPGGGAGFCGIDPQNLLQVGESRLLHGRWFRACGPGFDADMNARVVHDRNAGSLALVVPREGLRVSVDGEPVEHAEGAGPTERTGVVVLEADGVTIRAERARLRFAGDRIELVVGAAPG